MIYIHSNINIKDKNTFGMDVTCREWIDYTDKDDLLKIYSNRERKRIKSVGEGSNLLFAGDFDGTLIHNIADNYLYAEEDDFLELLVRAGTKMDLLVADAVEHGWWGIENLSGIPGTVGAAAVQNIGAYGTEIKDVITCVEVFDTVDLCFKAFPVDECAYAYRSSRFKHGPEKDRYVVTEVWMHLSHKPEPRLEYGNLRDLVGKEPSLRDIRKAVIQMRDSKLPNPAVYGNAGSFFMNPVISASHFEAMKEKFPMHEIPHFLTDQGIKVPAAWLIDEAGWKGYALRGAAVWEKQPLVIVNKTGDAKPGDIIELRDAIIADIKSKYDITLNPEVEEIR